MKRIFVFTALLLGFGLAAQADIVLLSNMSMPATSWPAANTRVGPWSVDVTPVTPSGGSSYLPLWCIDANHIQWDIAFEAHVDILPNIADTRFPSELTDYEKIAWLIAQYNGESAAAKAANVIALQAAVWYYFDPTSSLLASTGSSWITNANNAVLSNYDFSHVKIYTPLNGNYYGEDPFGYYDNPFYDAQEFMVVDSLPLIPPPPRVPESTSTLILFFNLGLVVAGSFLYKRLATRR